jgi:hypothetical protein
VKDWSCSQCGQDVRLGPNAYVEHKRDLKLRRELKTLLKSVEGMFGDTTGHPGPLYSMAMEQARHSIAADLRRILEGK